MGISVPIIVYTHTDMKDIWPMFFGQLKKYIGDTKVYVAVNEDDTQISDYIRIIYDDTKQYTERWKEILELLKKKLKAAVAPPLKVPSSNIFNLSFFIFTPNFFKHSIDDNTSSDTKTFLTDDIYLMQKLGLRPEKKEKDRQRMVKLARIITKKSIKASEPMENILKMVQNYH